MVLKLLAAVIPPTLFISALAAQPPPPVVAAQTVQDLYPADGVRRMPDLVYSMTASNRPVKLDLYLPPPTLQRPPQGFPLIVHLHGGGWGGGWKSAGLPFIDFPGVLSSLSARGYVVASLDYRLFGEATFPAPAQDVKAAIRWLRSRASEYGIDPRRAMTWGFSSGAHLAGLVAVSCNAQALEPVQTVKSEPPDAVGASRISDCVQGGVTWYGIFDIGTIAVQARQEKALSRDVPEAPEWRLLGCFARNCKPGQIAAASPVTYVDSKDPPMLLITGTEDKAVPYQQTLEMAEKLKAAGVPHELMVLPGVDHGFVGKTAEQTQEANLKALDATFRFIDKTMKSGR